MISPVKKRKADVLDNYSEEEIESSSEEEEDSDNEDTCKTCGYHGKLLLCDNCDDGYHYNFVYA